MLRGLLNQDIEYTNGQHQPEDHHQQMLLKRIWSGFIHVVPCRTDFPLSCCFFWSTSINQLTQPLTKMLVTLAVTDIPVNTRSTPFRLTTCQSQSWQGTNQTEEADSMHPIRSIPCTFNFVHQSQWAFNEGWAEQ